MTPRIIIGSLAVAVVIGARAWACYEDRRVRRELELEERARVRDLEFEKHVQTVLGAVEDPSEMAQLLQQERIKEMLAALLADWDDPAFGAFCERQFGSQTRIPGRPE